MRMQVLPVHCSPVERLQSVTEPQVKYAGAGTTGLADPAATIGSDRRRPVQALHGEAALAASLAAVQRKQASL